MKPILSRVVYFISIGVLTVFLAACGGGGGAKNDDDNGGQGSSDASTLAISASNATNIVSAALISNDIGTTYLDASTSSLGVATNRVDQHIDIRKYTEQKARRIFHAITEAGGVPAHMAGVLMENTYPCDSGTFKVSVDDADGDGVPSTGDTLTSTDDNCRFDGDDGDYLLSNGSFQLSDIVMDGDSDIAGTSWQFKVKATYDDYTLSVHTGEGDDSTFGIDGDVALDSGSADSGITEAYAITVGEFTVNLTSNDTSLFESSLQGYTNRYSVNNSTGEDSGEINGTLSESILGGNGRLQIETLVEFTGLADDDHYSAGMIRVTGANDSSVTLTVVDATNVILDVDEDGDGSIDTTIETTWAALES